MRSITIGSGKMTIGIVGSLHGNERIGRRVIGMLSSRPIDGIRLRMVIANEEALERNVRYMDTDLNRSFPGSSKGGHEARLASRITKELKGCDYVIDIHSTYARMEPVLITTTGTFKRKGVRRLIAATPLSKVLVMGSAIGRSMALIDIAESGISLEFNRSVPAARVYRIVASTVRNLSSGRSAKARKEAFSVTGFIDRPRGYRSLVRNFSKVKKGQPIAMMHGSRIRSKDAFYPVFASEKGYKGKLCMAAKRISGV